ncbi:MAG: c-type cytochrome [Planctomycetes bacterium]|nr:c-type cytochrome [Planctomycetota bacterium]
MEPGRGPKLFLAMAVVAVSGVAIAFAAGLQAAPPLRPAVATESPTARELYVKNCAACHGETGDGKGTTVLERPARSFKAGGFSYGNTPDAVLRTITHGIPGSLMPSFGEALAEADRKQLAAYVIALAPPDLVVEAKDTVMVVRDKPVIARGKLPPIGPVANETVRGLLVGLPSGLTFAYDIEEMRWLGTYSGEFADRRDWIGRGGDVLLPLGQLVRAAPLPRHPQLFTLRRKDGDAERLSTRLASTARSKDSVRIICEVRDSLRALVAQVEETPDILAGALGPGWKRTFKLQRRQSLKGLQFDFGNPAVARWCTVDHELAYMLTAGPTPAALDVKILRHPKEVSYVPGWIEVLADADSLQWTLYELPGVILPAAEDERHLALVRASMELR